VAAGSSFLTAFGGGTQSEALRWAVGRAAGRAAEAPRFAWRNFGTHIWACSGFLLACYLECIGSLGFLLDTVGFRMLVWLTSGFFVASAVLYSGWCSTTGRYVESQGAWKPIAWLGTFLYSCGGGLLRDLLTARPLAALDVSTLVPLTTGVVLCKGLRELGNARGGQGSGLVLLAGTPLVACLFAAFA